MKNNFQKKHRHTHDVKLYFLFCFASFINTPALHFSTVFLCSQTFYDLI